jgi:hypothetical protein
VCSTLLDPCTVLDIGQHLLRKLSISTRSSRHRLLVLFSSVYSSSTTLLGFRFTRHRVDLLDIDKFLCSRVASARLRLSSAFVFYSTSTSVVDIDGLSSTSSLLFVNRFILPVFLQNLTETRVDPYITQITVNYAYSV